MHPPGEKNCREIPSLARGNGVPHDGRMERAHIEAAEGWKPPSGTAGRFPVAAAHRPGPAPPGRSRWIRRCRTSPAGPRARARITSQRFVSSCHFGAGRVFAHGFGSDSAATIEQDRRHGPALLRILRWRSGRRSKMARRRDAKMGSCSCASPKSGPLGPWPRRPGRPGRSARDALVPPQVGPHAGNALCRVLGGVDTAEREPGAPPGRLGFGPRFPRRETDGKEGSRSPARGGRAAGGRPAGWSMEMAPVLCTEAGRAADFRRVHSFKIRTSRRKRSGGRAPPRPRTRILLIINAYSLTRFYMAESCAPPGDDGSVELYFPGSEKEFSACQPSAEKGARAESPLRGMPPGCLGTLAGRGARGISIFTDF